MSTTSTTSSVVATSTAGPAPAPAGASPGITSVAKSGKSTKVLTQASYQALVSGLQSTFQPTDTFNVPGGTLTRDQIIAQLNTFISAAEATKAARQQWLTAVAGERSTLGDVTPLRQSIRSILQGRFGKEGPALTSFGFSPAKLAKRTAHTKAAAAVKTAATREARHTMGTVQKKTVKGDVVGIAVTPLVASPPQPASGASAPPSSPSTASPSPTPSPASPATTSPAQPVASSSH
jgi:hypothetical protein